MAYIIPPMPLTCGVFDDTGIVPVLRLTCPCNLSMGVRTLTGASGGTSTIGVVFSTPYLLLPALTDIRDIYSSPLAADSVEVPSGSGRFYTVVQVDDFGKGFANEHRFAVLVKLPPWPVPIP